MIEEKSKVSIWNPGAVANWSLLFSPIFGGWLMSSNWKEMGDEAKAKSAMLWAYFGILLIVITIVLNFFVLPEGKNSNGLFLLYFLAWRFTSAKSQLKYVKDTFPDGYTKKGFMKPILIAVSVFVVYVALAFGLITAAVSAVPKCDSSEVNNVLIQIIKEQGIAPYGITDVKELSFNEKRFCEAILKSDAGEERFIYSVINKPETGEFYVEIQQAQIATEDTQCFDANGNWICE